MDHIPEPLSTLLSQPPSTLLQASLLTISAALITVQLSPQPLRTALFAYGARGSDPSALSTTTASSIVVASADFLAITLRRIGLLVRVPHSWFAHFYVTALAGLFFWAVEFVGRGEVLYAVAGREVACRGEGWVGVLLERVVLVWGMMVFQGVRRLFECWVVARPSGATMLAVHWLVSQAFYAAVTVGVWIEGSAAILRASSSSLDWSRLLDPQIIVSAALFLFASYQQHSCHRYLASLPKYTLPNEGWFRNIVCPHYLCECLIYLSLSLVAAPAGERFNRTLLAILCFSAANLACTAHNTKLWYMTKFGPEQVTTRWKMVPLLF